MIRRGELGGDQRLLLRDDGDLGDHLGKLVGGRLIDGGSRECRVLRDVLGLLADSLGGRGGVGTLAAEHLLDLAGVVTSVLLSDGAHVLSLLLDDTLNLCSLSIDDVGSALEVLVDQLLVRGVNQRDEESHSGSDKSKAPVRDDLDEVVREESCDTSSSGSPNILDEHNALSLNHEEVDELVNIADSAVQGLTGNRVVLAWADLRSQASVKDELASGLSDNGSEECP
jgi:hypothetical protein